MIWSHSQEFSVALCWAESWIMLFESGKGKWPTRDLTQSIFAIWLLTVCPLKLRKRDLRYYSDAFPLSWKICLGRQQKPWIWHAGQNTRSLSQQMEKREPAAVSNESLWCWVSFKEDKSQNKATTGIPLELPDIKFPM